MEDLENQGKDIKALISAFKEIQHTVEEKVDIRFLAELQKKHVLYLL